MLIISYDKENIIYYKLDNYYAPKFESGLFIMIQSINLNGQKKNDYIKKDKNLLTLKNLKKI